MDLNPDTDAYRARRLFINRLIDIYYENGEEVEGFEAVAAAVEARIRDDLMDAAQLVRPESTREWLAGWLARSFGSTGTSSRG